MKYIPEKKLIILFLFFSCTLFAAESEQNNTEKQYKLQRYEDIKKEQKKEYKKGVYNDEKKDYVNDWIGKDINYQKKVIKLKKEYREWAADKISKKQEVRFRDYEPLKSMTRVEKQILYEYHCLLFKDEKKQKRIKRKRTAKKKKTLDKKPAETQIDKQININSEIPPPGNETSNNNDTIVKPGFILLGIAGILIIIVIIFLFIKIKKIKKGQ